MLVWLAEGTAHDRLNAVGRNEVFERWRQYCLEWEPRVQSRYVGLSVGILSFSFDGDMAVALASIEKLVRDYEQQSGKLIDDEVRIGTAVLVMRDLPLKEHLVRNSYRLSTWAEFRHELLEIGRARRH